MRTLKKTLCLVLVLAMVMSCGIFASADFSDFPDADEVVNVEAVSVLTALGVITGDEAPDGTISFNPTGTLTRAQAAVILVRMLGAEDIAVGKAPFTDMEGYENWAEGAIAYCAAAGIVAGYGDGTYGPGDPLDGSAWLKMLAVALGFDAEANGMTGDAWRIGVAVLAKNLGLTAGVAPVDPYEPISRDTACACAFNALRYAPDGGTTKYVVTNAAGNVIYSGTNEDTAALIAGLTTGATLTEVTTNDGSLGDRIYGLTEGKATDEFGRVSKTWTNGKDGKDEVVYVSFEPTPVLTYTTATTDGKIAAALGATVSKGVSLTVIEDGVKGTAANVNKTGTTTIGGQGTLVEVYKNGEAYDVIVINTYVAELAKDDITAAKAATATEDAVDASITIGELTYKTDAFKEGDVVLYTKGTTDGTADTAKIANVVKADYVTGKIEAVGAGSAYIKIDGVQYKAAANIKDGALGAGLYALGENNTYYLDNYNNVIYATETKDNTAPVETTYVYVIATAAKAAGNDKTEGDNLFDQATIPGSAAVAQAQIIDLATGEIKVVNQAVVKGTDGKYYYANSNGAVPSNDADKVIVTGDGSVTAVGAILAYTELDDGSYVLGAVADTEDQVVLTQNKANVTITNGEGEEAETTVLRATSTTVVTVVEYETDKDGKVTSATVTTYTGIANLPKDGLTLENALVKNKDGIISSITAVQKKDTAPKAEPATYAVYAGEGETVLDKDGNAVTLYAFYVGGEKVEYYGAEGFTAPDKGAVVKLTVTENKAATESAKAAATAVKVTFVDETFFIAGDQVYYFADGAVTVDSGDNYAAATVAKGDYVTVYTNDKGDVEFIVITEAPKAPAAPEEPAEDAPAEDAPAEDTPAEDAPAEDAPAEDTPAEDTPAEDTPAEDTPAEDTPAEDTSAE